jgi:hypothetical protein
MFEISCKHCKEKTKVPSLLMAAQQPCPSCGQLLMGDLMPSTRTTRPSSAEPALPQEVADRPAPPMGSIWMGMTLGGLAGGVLGLASILLENALEVSDQGMILGALAGVLMAPLILLSLLFSAIVRPILNPVSMQHMMAKSVMDQLADAVNEGRYMKLYLGGTLFFLCGMGVGGFLGSRVHAIPNALQVCAVLGAASLGAYLGIPLGAAFIKPESATEGTAASTPKSDGARKETQ